MAFGMVCVAGGLVGGRSKFLAAKPQESGQGDLRSPSLVLFSEPATQAKFGKKIVSKEKGNFDLHGPCLLAELTGLSVFCSDGVRRSFTA